MNALLLAALVATTATSPVQFERHAIAPFPSGYQVAVADLNADGRPDVIAVSTDASRADWYENPSWREHRVTRVDRGVDIAPYDLDDDQRPEIVIAAGFNFSDSARGGEVLWLDPPGPAEPDADWRPTTVTVDPVTHRVAWADVDGDRRPELIHAPIFGPGSKANIDTKPVHFWAFRIPADPKAAPWTPWRIDETLTVLHGIHVGDLDGDGRDEILTASYEGVNRFDLEGRGADAAWQRTPIGPGAPPANDKPGAPRGSSEVTWGVLAAGRPYIGTVEPWHGDMVVVYTPTDGPKGAWERRVLDDTIAGGHAAVAADLDADGVEELLIGWRRGQGGLAIYDPDPSGRIWRKIPLETGLKVEDAAIADLNADGRPDIIAIARESSELVWFENRGPRKE